MSRIAYVDGAYMPHAAACVHIEDRGYQFADGVYEVCALREGVLLFEDAHLARLDESLKALNIAAPMSKQALRLVLRETVRRNHIRHGIVYFQITRGQAPREHGFGDDIKPVLVVTVRAISPQTTQAIHKEGIRIITQPDMRWARCDIKSIALLPNILARSAAQEANAQEAWLIDEDGFITEGAATSAWIVDKKGVLRTRPNGQAILPGITRQLILELVAAEKLDFVEQPFTLDEAYEAQEAFATASSVAILPIIAINDKPIGTGKPGKISRLLLKIYEKNVAKCVKKSTLLESKCV